MSGSSRSTQGQGQTARPAPLPVTDALVLAIGVRAFGAPGAPRAESGSQGRAKHAHLCPECDQLFSCFCSFGWKVAYMRCGCVHDCSICRRVHGEEVKHASE